MKLILSSFCFCCFFVCASAFGEKISLDYVVKVSGIKIGKLNWTIKIDDLTYRNNINLESWGLLSGIYRFEGRYYSEGVIKKGKLKPIHYKHFWKTNKTNKEMSLVFENDNLKKITQIPIEDEHLRIDIFDIKQSRDPLTSFLQIMLGEEDLLVVDGRRMYRMNVVYNKDTNQNIVEVSNYYNLWADHKRNKFEKIIFEKNINEILPFKMLIFFDGRVFRLEEN